HFSSKYFSSFIFLPLSPLVSLNWRKSTTKKYTFYFSRDGLGNPNSPCLVPSFFYFLCKSNKSQKNCKIDGPGNPVQSVSKVRRK
ncbi:unnamed protein product, partial [Linum tenue]